jgi:hypothetical protein
MVRAASLVLLLALGAARLEGVALRWKPTEEVGGVISAAARAFQGKKVAVKPFEDARDEKELIGKNVEDAKPKLVTTRDDVGAWCATRLEALVREAGTTVVEADADLVITGKVTHFMVEEGDHYRGRVSVRLQVADAAGKELWSGVVSGSSKRFGRSYKEENYMETLSDAYLAALDAFFNDPKLRS